MSSSSQERILYPEDGPAASAEQARDSLNSSLEEIVGQASESLAVNEWTRQSVDRLNNLFQILTSGLSPDVESKHWFAFINHLSGETQRFAVPIGAFSVKGDAIGNLINKYGLSIRSNMVVNQLLTEDALEKLKELNEHEWA